MNNNTTDSGHTDVYGTRGSDGGFASAREYYRDYCRECEEDGVEHIPFELWLRGE